MTSLVNKQWYIDLVDDCQNTIVEGVFEHNWLLIQTYHHLGRRIAMEWERVDEMNIGRENFVQGLADDIGKSKRMVRYAVAMYNRFPSLDEIPEGKNITMNQIINKYLTDGKKKERKKRAITCPNCEHEFEI